MDYETVSNDRPIRDSRLMSYLYKEQDILIYEAERTKKFIRLATSINGCS